MPFVSSGSGGKRYYIGHFFKANWYKSNQYCRFHGMHLASIESKTENDALEKFVTEFGNGSQFFYGLCIQGCHGDLKFKFVGLGNEHFWTSGTDQGEEGAFFWFGNGKPITFTNWNAGQSVGILFEVLILKFGGGERCDMGG
jgi:hypothetical protein